MSNIRRWEFPGETYHVTFHTRFRRKILAGNLANIVAEEISQLRGEKDTIIHSWVIMPDHVHLLVTPKDGKISKVLNLLKGRTGRYLHKLLPDLDRIWAKRYYDRRLREADEIVEHSEYIIQNPVKAGLCENPEDWQWSSAFDK